MNDKKRTLFKRSSREPIPWVNKNSPLFSSWNWETEHFILTILGAGPEGARVFQWKVADKSSGERITFDEGEEISFQRAVDMALEIISKGYPRNYGYGAYAGGLQNTFNIADNSRIDFTPVVGKEVIVVAKGNDSSLINIIGGFDISHYDVIVQRNGQTTVIPPNRIVDVLVNNGAKSMIDEMRT